MEIEDPLTLSPPLTYSSLPQHRFHNHTAPPAHSEHYPKSQ